MNGPLLTLTAASAADGTISAAAMTDSDTSVPKALAMDGKTMKNAIDDAGRQAHIMSVIGHESNLCHTQKKWAPCP